MPLALPLLDAAIVDALVADCDRALLDEPTSLLSRLVARLNVDRISARGCWRFQGAMSQSGRRGVFYPHIKEGHGTKRNWRVNRLVLVLTVGRVDVLRDEGEPFIEWLSRARRHYEDWEASHEVCDDSMCCNPSHLEFQSHTHNVTKQAARRRAARSAATQGATA